MLLSENKKMLWGYMMGIHILNKEEQSIDISDAHVTQVKEYLAILDLIKEIDLEYLLEVNQKRKMCNDYTSLWQNCRKVCDLSWRKYRVGYDSVFKC